MTSTASSESAASSADAPVNRPRTVSTLMRLHPFVKGSYTRLTLGIGTAIVGAVVALAIPVVLSWIVDGPLTTLDTAQIFPAVGLIAALGVLEALLIALRRWLVLKPGTHADGAMRKSIYNHLQQLPLAFHDKWQSGQLLSRAMSDISTVMAAVFTACSLPMLFFGIRFELRYRALSRSAQDQAGDVATNVEESVHGIRVLKAFGRSTFALDGFSARAKRLRRTETTKGVVIGNFTLGLTVLEAVAYALSLVVGIFLVSSGAITVGVLFAFFTTAAVLRWPLDSIGFLLQLTIDARTALDRFFEVIDEPVRVEEAAHPRELPADKGSLIFENVSFKFADAPEGASPLLRDLSLAVRPGETMAVVGLTGSGKTTLTGLTTRLYDVTGGRILVDGVDIRDARLSDLRSRVAMAFEDATLFYMSVRENVLLGRPDLLYPAGEAEKAASDQLLSQALEIAQADFVYSLPDGIDTKIGEEGLSLSGGQRQRLALARAIVTQPAVLVLDDPLSALDVTTEQQVEAALRRVLATTTALIVAHRPSTVMLADRVAVLHEGRLAEVGTHSELLARSALYRHIISSESDEPHELSDATGDNEVVIDTGAQALGEVDGTDGVRGILP